MVSKAEELVYEIDVDDPYPAVVAEEVLADGRRWFVARHPDLPGCMSDGASPAEARRHLAEARALYLATLAEDGLPVPLPSRLTRTS